MNSFFLKKRISMGLFEIWQSKSLLEIQQESYMLEYTYKILN